MAVNTQDKPTIDAPRAAIATLLVFLAIAFIPSFIATTFSSDVWYEALAKPSWNPPRWLFGPVWTVLYTLIGYAGYLAWSSSVTNQRYAALAIYVVQLLLNALWSPLFFGYHSPSLACSISLHSGRR
jgi:translocator protein